MFQILVNRMFRDLPGEAGSRFFQEIIVVENQGHGVQVVEALNIVNIGSHGKAGALSLLLVNGKLGKKKDSGDGVVSVAGSGFPEGLDLPDGKGGLGHGPVDVAHALSLHGLHVAVSYQAADCPAKSVAGAVISLDQCVLRW